MRTIVSILDSPVCSARECGRFIRSWLDEANARRDAAQRAVAARPESPPPEGVRAPVERHELPAAGNTLGEVIEDLERKHPGIRDRLLDDKGVRRFVNIYVGEEDVRFLDGLKTALKAGDQISIVPAIAGG